MASSDKRSYEVALSNDILDHPSFNHHAQSSVNQPTSASLLDPDSQLEDKRAKIGIVHEKRLARTRTHCSIKVQERLERVMSQRFFMVTRTRVGTELREKFEVLDKTVNTYTVIVDKRPSCTCPDALKDNICKHLLYASNTLGLTTTVFSFQIDNLSTHSALSTSESLESNPKHPPHTTNTLLTSELEEIFSNAPAAPNGLTSERMQLINAAVTGNTTASSKEEMAPRRRPLKRGDPCPICYEDLSSDLTNALVFCETGCGEALHRECRLKWSEYMKQQDKAVGCVFCQADWPITALPPTASYGGRTHVVGNLNLAPAAAIPSLAPYIPASQPRNNWDECDADCACRQPNRLARRRRPVMEYYEDPEEQALELEWLMAWEEDNGYI